MTELDTTILWMSGLLVLIASGVGRGVGLSFIVFMSLIINQWTLKTLNIDTFIDFYITGIDWMAMVVAVDLAAIALLAYRSKPDEMWLILTFGASAIFHLFCRLEFIGRDSDAMPLYDMRFDFVKNIAALQLGGVILNLIGGGWSGGKLVKLSFNRLNFFSRRVSSTKAFKVIK